MLRLLCFLLFISVLQHVRSSSWEMVEVTLAGEHYGSSTLHNSLDDFRELFDEFAELHGIHFNKRNFREIETNINGLPVAKYGLRNVDCEQFRQFLSGIKAQTYHLQYASVKCGPMTFSFCMSFSCVPEYFASTTVSPSSFNSK